MVLIVLVVCAVLCFVSDFRPVCCFPDASSVSGFSIIESRFGFLSRLCNMSNGWEDKALQIGDDKRQNQAIINSNTTLKTKQHLILSSYICTHLYSLQISTLI